MQRNNENVDGTLDLERNSFKTETETIILVIIRHSKDCLFIEKNYRRSIAKKFSNLIYCKSYKKRKNRSQVSINIYSRIKRNSTIP